MTVALTQTLTLTLTLTLNLTLTLTLILTLTLLRIVIFQRSNFFFSAFQFVCVTMQT